MIKFFSYVLSYCGDVCSCHVVDPSIFCFLILHDEVLYDFYNNLFNMVYNLSLFLVFVLLSLYFTVCIY